LNYIDELGLSEIDKNDLLIKNLSKEKKYQETINEAKPIKIPPGKLPRLKPKKYGNSKRYPVNPRISKNALEIAEYKCEINKDHNTFLNKKSKMQYMEAHHLIPMSKQDEFDCNIDVPENVLCLCPNCHRKIHLAEDVSKKEILKQAFEKRKQQLPQREIFIGFDALLNIYDISK